MKRDHANGSARSTTGRILLSAALAVLAGAPVVTAAEVLVEHIEDYSSSASSNLPGCADTADGLYDEFGRAGGWTRTWWSNASAWEQDFKSDHLPGGDDGDWSDDDDFGYFCGHGNVGLVEFTTSNPGKLLTSTEGRWGDEDVEWVTFDTSMTLRDSGNNLVTWYVNGFNELHLLVGWHDSPLDGDTGGEFADELIDHGIFDGGGKTVSAAWFSGSGGCTDQNSGTTQMILAEIQAHYDDHIQGEGSMASDQPNNGLGWKWRHDC